MGRRINFKPGDKINLLTVIGPTQDRSPSGNVIWECRCDCGNICYVQSTRLKTERVKSCGCLSKKMLDKGRYDRVVDKTGQRYGHLLVLKRDFEKEKQGQGVRWKCQCDCGRISSILSSNLKKDKKSGTLSCGKCHCSHGETEIETILRQNNMLFEREFKFLDCKDTRCLPFDFYVNESYLIEFDGMQHFTEVDNNFFDHKLCKKHDAIKNNYCHKNNIPLIRIPYFLQGKITIEDLRPETTKWLC